MKLKDTKKSERWKTLARHKWISEVVITQFCDRNSSRKRFIATILGYQGWRIWEGIYDMEQGMVEKVCAKVRELTKQFKADKKKAKRYTYYPRAIMPCDFLRP